MDVADFCRRSRVLVVAGKGGVGKTTIAAALSWMAADAGLSVLLVELEGRPVLAAALGGSGPLGYEETELRAPSPASGPGRVLARRITPDEALIEYLDDHGLRRVTKRLLSSGVLDVVATAIPGIRDVLVLGKIKQLEQAGAADLIVVDAPATGHAMTFLTSARGLLDVARGGPVRAQAAEVVELLRDASRCRVVLVTIPEEMPISETVEAAYQIEDRAGVQLGPVVVNSVDTLGAGMHVEAAVAAARAGVQLGAAQLASLEEARIFRLRRWELQAELVDRLGRELPLPQLHAPQLPALSLGPTDVGTLAHALADGVRALAPDVHAA
ncbi:MAG TPA: ArsA family ATPase [Acidimicrobiales bacterium]|nr:ArsA family ATPase [Acidimicrobiales bacterium]